MNKDMLEAVSERTGLSVSAVHDMLEGGWTYVEEMGLTPRWEAPIANFHR